MTRLQAASNGTSTMGALCDVLIALLQEHERDGALPTNARFLFYELVQRSRPLCNQRRAC